MEPFRFRLNCIDWYLSTPTDYDPVLRPRRSADAAQQQYVAPQVPVIRVFGATESGQKVCAHIHGALPYLYLEYDGSLDTASVDAYISSLRTSIDHALAIAYRRDPYKDDAVYVGHISLVKGVPFYGYNVGYRPYLKVYLLNPAHMTRFADLLGQGAILGRAFQPHESHLQYLLQWMCDYNLYGCAYIDCSVVSFRSPVPDSSDINTTRHKWHSGTIPLDSITESDRCPRQSHCALEVDVCVQDISNRYEVQPRLIHHDFQERFKASNPDEKFVPSMAGLWRDETRRRKLRMGITDPSSSPFPPEVLVPMSADARDSGKGGWVHEKEYRDLVEALARDEGAGNAPVTFDTFLKRRDGMQNIKTALESVEDLYPCNFQSQVPAHEIVAIDRTSSDDMSAVPGNDAESAALAEDANGPDEPHDDYPSKEGEGASLDPLSTIEAGVAGTNVSENPEISANTTGESAIADQEPGPGNGSSPHKRPNDPVVEEQPPKRQRVLAAPDQKDTRRVRFDQTGVDESSENCPQTSQERRSTTQPAHKQSSIKAHGTKAPSTLSFPVVKNPNDPDTLLRLSQSGYSNLQDVPRTPKDGSRVDRSIGRPTGSWSDQTVSPPTQNNRRLQPDPQVAAMVSGLAKGFPHTPRTFYYGVLPPSTVEVEATTMQLGLPPVLYQDAYYSKDEDVPDRPREYAGREFRLQSTALPYLPPFDSTGTSLANFGKQPLAVVDCRKESFANQLRAWKCELRNWELSAGPPSYKEVSDWLQAQPKPQPKATRKPKNKVKTKAAHRGLSQIEGPTQKNKHGFKYSQKTDSTSVKHETQYMSTLSVEIHVNSRGSLAPDPAEDEIQAIFWAIRGEESGNENGARVGIICLSDEDGVVQTISKQVSVEVEFEDDELELMNRMVDIVRQFDPDILTGYEVHNGSWGYLIERARIKYEYNLCSEFSRVKAKSNDRIEKDNGWGFTHTSMITVTGRHMINIWRAMRGELNLLQYTMENVVFHLLHKRIPHYSHEDLTRWYSNQKPRDLAKVLGYFISRVQINLDILEANEIIPRTSEQARLLGVDFFSVISRGSQFKVESTMFRIAKPENFILVSPSRKQVGQQNALECLPLVMEPQSNFYTSPVLVLDFQSLYPSVMIAYNYCYSTCLGRIVSWRGRNKLGFMDFQREPQLVSLVKDHINIAPNGMMYVRPSLRKSLLAKMLGELLETRVMVKSGMKQDQNDKTLQQLLNNRQLALKLLANVTYGYTSASFSGRMPCSEIADSIVQTGRETLEKAIALIHSTEKWAAEVVYGDTDSLFIHLPGRTRAQAFTIGDEIAKAVTARNPRPVKLKFEKVYHPCILLAKKRYVGFKYESASQKEPEFEAKGIETVRRDGTPAEQKIEEKALKILFRSSDLSQVKSYFQSQCSKIMSGRISIQDFLFAKEVKLGTYSERGPPPPGALIATKRMLADARAEPQYGERVPYVVITGAPGARLIDRCVSPEELLKNDALELDAEYYISKNLIPPLERIFNLVGANVRQWYEEMPKVQKMRNIAIPLTRTGGPGDENEEGAEENSEAVTSALATTGKSTLESYMHRSSCILCNAKLPQLPLAMELDAPRLPLCTGCLSRPARTLLRLKWRITDSEQCAQDLDRICRGCANLAWGEEVRCDSRDCPVFYSRVRQKGRMEGIKEGVAKVAEVLEDMEW